MTIVGCFQEKRRLKREALEQHDQIQQLKYRRQVFAREIDNNLDNTEH